VTPSAWGASFKVMQFASLGAVWGSSTGMFISNNTYNDGVGNKYIGNGFATRYYQSTGQHIWETAANNTSGAGASATLIQAMTFDSSGNLGIGVTPTARLEIGEASGIVARLSRITSGNNIDINYYNPISTAGDIARIRVDGDGISNLYGAISFWTTQTPNSLVERVRIGSSGTTTITGPNVGNTSLIVRNANNANSGEILIGGTTYGTKIVRDSLGADQDLIFINSHGGAQGFKFRTGATTAGTTDLVTITGGGNVGINESSPTTRLHVKGANTAARGQLTVVGDGADARISLYRDSTFHVGISAGSSDSYIGTESNTPFRFLTNGTERVRIDSSGNVGIGTQTVDAKLRVQASTQGIFVASNSATPAASTMFQVNAQGNDSSTYIAQFGSLNAGIRVVMRSDGNVGINNTTPETTLTVSANKTDPSTGQLRLTGTDTAKILSLGYNTTSNYGMIQSLIAGVGYSNTVIQPEGGNVGIGTTNPGAKLHVAGDSLFATTSQSHTMYFGSATGDIYLRRDNSYDLTLAQNEASGYPLYLAGAGNVVVSIDSNNNETDRKFIVGNNAIKSTNELFSVNESGNGYLSGTLTEASSITLKENINPIADALSIISNLTGYTYDRKDGTAKNRAGLIAEEVEHILPNVVTYDAEGNASGVQYTNIIAYLVESIKELKKELDTLKS
jgi:hypothetical protein